MIVEVARLVVVRVNQVETGVAGGSVAVGNMEVGSALIGVVITSERRLKGTELAGVGRSVIVRVVIASAGRLTIVAVPSEAWTACIIVILFAEIVTLIVELDGIMFKKACEALKRKKI